MYRIHNLNNISPKGTALWTENYTQTDDPQQADAILVRSANMHEMPLSANLLAVSRAGAGVNNIPLTTCAEAGIVVFNTPGANANSVMELSLCGMLLSSRDVVGGINWVQSIKDTPDVAKQVEKGKSRFAGHEIRGKSLGVIGLGAVGGPLANAAGKLGMTVYGCDPYISIDAAWHLDSSIIKVNTREEIYEKCDIISLHTPLLDSTRQMINAEALSKMRDGVIVLNFARDLLVDDEAMAQALASGKVSRYVTDFPNEKTASMPGCIAIPHLGASTQESEDNCAKMAVREVMDYLEHGNIHILGHIAVVAGQLRIADGAVEAEALCHSLTLNAAHVPAVPAEMLGGVFDLEDLGNPHQNAAAELDILQFGQALCNGCIHSHGGAGGPAIVHPVTAFYQSGSLFGSGQFLLISCFEIHLPKPHFLNKYNRAGKT